jgi:hypothetical protein
LQIDHSLAPLLRAGTIRAYYAHPTLVFSPRSESGDSDAQPRAVVAGDVVNGETTKWALPASGSARLV